MNRQQKQIIQQDLTKKMVFLVGPRQVGKTWLAQDIATHTRQGKPLKPSIPTVSSEFCTDVTHTGDQKNRDT
jgi:chromosomal replication initiation ATPase DnaA